VLEEERRAERKSRLIEIWEREDEGDRGMGKRVEKEGRGETGEGGRRVSVDGEGGGRVERMLDMEGGEDVRYGGWRGC
jgi:hypothetical protein